MASIYARGNRIWCKLKHADGEWRASRTPFGPGSEQQAQRYADEAQRQIDGKAPKSDESMTVEAWSVSWLKGRREKHEATSRRYEATGSGKVQYRGHRGDSSMMRLHVLPYIGALRVAEVVPRHLTGWIHTLRTTTALSTTTIRNVYGLASTMFRDAAIAGRIASNPCNLGADQLGEREDANGAGRYTREQFELMIGSAQLSERARIFAALGGLAGLRLGAIAGLRWGDLLVTTAPLWRLTSSRTYRNRPTKTQRPSVIPVHPALADMLASWRHGWGQRFGRAPTADDPIVPHVGGEAMSKKTGWRLMHKVLTVLAIPAAPMPLHALRSTFISVALEDGADDRLIRRITHPVNQSRDAFARYDRADYWPRLCAEVAKIRICRRSGGSVAVLGTSRVTPLDGTRGKGRKTMEMESLEKEKPPGTVPGSVSEKGHIVPLTPRDRGGATEASRVERRRDVPQVVHAMMGALDAGDVARVLALADELRALQAQAVAL